MTASTQTLLIAKAKEINRLKEPQNNAVNTSTSVDRNQSPEPRILNSTSPSPIDHDTGNERPQAARSRKGKSPAWFKGEDAHIKREHPNRETHVILIIAFGLLFMREKSLMLTYIVGVIVLATLASKNYYTNNISACKKMLGRICKRATLTWVLFPMLLYTLLCTLAWNTPDSTSSHATWCWITCALVATLRVLMTKYTVNTNQYADGRVIKGTMSHWTLPIIFFLLMAVQCSQLRDAPPEGVKLPESVETLCLIKVSNNETRVKEQEHKIASFLWRTKHQLDSDEGECPFEPANDFYKNNLYQVTIDGGGAICRCVQEKQSLASAKLMGSKATRYDIPECNGEQMLEEQGYSYVIPHTEDLSPEQRKVKSFCRDPTSKWSDKNGVKARCIRMKLTDQQCKERYCKDWDKDTYPVHHATVRHSYITDPNGESATGTDVINVSYRYLDSQRSAEADKQEAKKMQIVAMFYMLLLGIIVLLLYAEYDTDALGCLRISGQMEFGIGVDWVCEIAAIAVMGNACFQDHWKIGAFVLGAFSKGIFGFLLTNAGEEAKKTNKDKNPQQTAADLIKEIHDFPHLIRTLPFMERVNEFAKKFDYYGTNIKASVFFGGDKSKDAGNYKNSLQFYLTSEDSNQQLEAREFLKACLDLIKEGKQPLSWEEQKKPPFFQQMGDIVTGTGNLFLIILRCIRCIYKAAGFIVKYLAVDAPNYVKYSIGGLIGATGNYFVIAIMSFDNRFNAFEIIFAVLSLMDNTMLKRVHESLYPAAAVNGPELQKYHDLYKTSLTCQQEWFKWNPIWFLDWKISPWLVNKLLPVLCFPADFTSASWWIFVITMGFLVLLFVCLVDECCVRFHTWFNNNEHLRELWCKDRGNA